MPRLLACPSCNSHVRADERECPHCGVAIRDVGGRIGRTASAVLMGLSLSACADKDDGNDETTASTVTAQPEYGVPATEGEPDYGVPVTGESSSGESGSSSSSESGTTIVGEPEYGVAETGTTGDTDTDTDGSTSANG
jgi:hypothetical protein